MSTATWDSCAAEYAVRIEPFTALFGQDLLERASLSASDRLLDLAAGSGAAVALPAARICLEVCAVDSAPSMLKLLEQRAAEQSLGNVVAVLADGSDLGVVKDFDVAISNFGVIFFADFVAGLCEMHQALRPSGRALISAWGSSSETPAFALIPEMAREIFGADRFSVCQVDGTKRVTGSPEFLKEAFEKAGFEDIEVTGPHSRFVETSTPEAFWDRQFLGAPGTQKLLASLGPTDAEILRAKVLERLEADFGSGPVRLSAAAYFAGGRRPGDAQN